MVRLLNPSAKIYLKAVYMETIYKQYSNTVGRRVTRWDLVIFAARVYRNQKVTC